MSFAVLTRDLDPYQPVNADVFHVEWQTPIIPQGHKGSVKVNQSPSRPRHSPVTLSRGGRKLSFNRRSHAQTKSTAKQTRARQRTPPEPNITDYAFIRRDDDYEPFVSEIWHDQITRGWPKAIPYTTPQGINVAVRQCVKFIATDDSAYYILLCGGIIGYTSARHDTLNVTNLPRLFHKVRVKAVQALRKDISDLKDGMPSDALMASILSFAVQETVYNTDGGSGPNWSRSPLARAQLLGWAGGLQRHAQHLEAFYHLLDRRGGVESVTDPGLRRLIYICDLLTASVAATSPRYPLYGFSTSLIEYGKLQLDDEAQDLRQNFGHQLSNFSALSWQFLESLLEILPDIRDVTIAVDMYHRTKGKHPHLGELADYANSVHYRILSLGTESLPHGTPSLITESTPDSGDDYGTDDDPLSSAIARQTLEPVRLATLVYSNMVIFPVQFTAGVASHLAKSLRALYESDQVRIFEPELELWVVVMGCVASWGTNDRKWYIERVEKILEESYYLNMAAMETLGEEGFLELLRGFLWWEYTCLTPAKEVWKQLREMKFGNVS